VVTKKVVIKKGAPLKPGTILIKMSFEFLLNFVKKIGGLLNKNNPPKT
jgi:hypothetical protein